jgi:hypothetical protein
MTTRKEPKVDHFWEKARLRGPATQEQRIQSLIIECQKWKTRYEDAKYGLDRVSDHFIPCEEPHWVPWTIAVIGWATVVLFLFRSTPSVETLRLQVTGAPKVARHYHPKPVEEVKTERPEYGNVKTDSGHSEDMSGSLPNGGVPIREPVASSDDHGCGEHAEWHNGACAEE